MAGEHMLCVFDPTTLPGITVEVLAAGAVILVVKMFLNHMRESKQDFIGVIDRNTTALTHNSEAMDRMADAVGDCRALQHEKRV